MQQINLLNQLTIPQKPWLPAQLIVRLVLWSLLLMAITTVLARGQLWLDNRYLAQVSASKQSAEQSLTALTQKFPQVVSEEALQKQLTLLEEALVHKREALEKFAQSTKLRGFSVYLAMFSRHIPEGVWLNSFVIDTDNLDVKLEGNTLNPGLVPRFIDALAQSDYFEYDSFHAFAINQVKDKPYYHFSLGQLEIEKVHDEFTQQGVGPAMGAYGRGIDPKEALEAIKIYQQSEKQTIQLLEKLQGNAPGGKP